MKNFVEDLIAAFETKVHRSHFVARINKAATPAMRFNAIRGFYLAARSQIESVPSSVWAIDPYEVDWISRFTPIEAAMWSHMRVEGVVLYPQFPVRGFFVDFGHPVAKVAIECDGAAYHQDQHRDAVRQKAIEAEGWTVYRFTGSECMQDCTYGRDAEGEETVIPSETQIGLRRIADRHFLRATRS